MAAPSHQRRMCGRRSPCAACSPRFGRMSCTLSTPSRASTAASPLVWAAFPSSSAPSRGSARSTRPYHRLAAGPPHLRGVAATGGVSFRRHGVPEPGRPPGACRPPYRSDKQDRAAARLRRADDGIRSGPLLAPATARHTCLTRHSARCATGDDGIGADPQQGRRRVCRGRGSVRQRVPTARFLLVGGADPDSVEGFSTAELEQFRQTIHWPWALAPMSPRSSPRPICSYCRRICARVSRVRCSKPLRWGCRSSPRIAPAASTL